MLLALMLSGAMRWDIRRPWLRFADRFVLSAGHTVPVVYASLAVLNESLRLRHELDGDKRFTFPDDGRWALTPSGCSGAPRGLPGHAEMAGRTLFFGQHRPPHGCAAAGWRSRSGAPARTMSVVRRRGRGP
jgi:transketolase